MTDTELIPQPRLDLVVVQRCLSPAQLYLDSLAPGSRPAMRSALKTLVWGMALMATGFATAQSQTVKIIVGYPPGATSDLLTRVVAEAMAKRLGQPVIVENRAGAGGQLGNLAVKGAEQILKREVNASAHAELLTQLKAQL